MSDFRFNQLLRMDINMCTKSNARKRTLLASHGEPVENIRIVIPQSSTSRIQDLIVINIFSADKDAQGKR